ncbi:MAG TPA: tetratricopeptide repeat protein [Anaerolineales bacterium]|nr:tetratricopeptide repeat protein [Anaerolineales bacterium]
MKPEPRYQPGDKIGGRYQVHQSLMGSMGEVYLCLDLEQNYPLALKTFQFRFLKRQKVQDAFYTEVATWVALEKHPNIVRCFYMDNIDGRPFMFLEWIASDESLGTDLRSWLRQGRISTKLAILFVMDICNGLIHAQKKAPGIVHRDLKPENVLIAQGQVAKITDFGLASIIKVSDLTIPDTSQTDGGRQSMVGSRGVVGTPAYMAPEQWRSEEPDVRTDIYAIGCVLYESLTRKLPYMANNLEGFLRAHLTSPIPLVPPELDCPEGIEHVIARCLAKRREDRYAHVDDLLADLTRVFAEHFEEAPRILKAAGGYTAIDYNYRGVTYDKLDRYTEAISDYTRAIELDSSFFLAYNNRGATYERLRRYDEAIMDYTSAIQLTPSLSQAYYNRGNVFSKRKKSEEAIDDFTRSLQLDPELMRAYINRGSEYYGIGRYEEALADFTEAINLQPNYAKAHVNRGVVYDSLRNYDKAIEDYSQAIHITPDDPAVYYNRGLTYTNMSRYDLAAEDFTKVIELNPEDSSSYYLRGLCYAELGRVDEAIQDHYTVISMNISPGVTALNQGTILFNQGKLEEALVQFREAVLHGERRGEQWVVFVDNRLNSGNR